MMQKLVSPKIVGLKITQADFQRYQSSAFVERSASFFALELAGECGELANLEKKIWRDPANPPDMKHVADEAADVFIALMNYCNARGIDLESAVTQKLERIEERRLAGLMGV